MAELNGLLKTVHELLDDKPNTDYGNPPTYREKDIQGKFDEIDKKYETDNTTLYIIVGASLLGIVFLASRKG